MTEPDDWPTARRSRRAAGARGAPGPGDPGRRSGCSARRGGGARAIPRGRLAGRRRLRMEPAASARWIDQRRRRAAARARHGPAGADPDRAAAAPHRRAAGGAGRAAGAHRLVPGARRTPAPDAGRGPGHPDPLSRSSRPAGRRPRRSLESRCACRSPPPPMTVTGIASRCSPLAATAAVRARLPRGRPHHGDRHRYGPDAATGSPRPGAAGRRCRRRASCAAIAVALATIAPAPDPPAEPRRRSRRRRAPGGARPGSTARWSRGAARSRCSPSLALLLTSPVIPGGPGSAEGARNERDRPASVGAHAVAGAVHRARRARGPDRPRRRRRGSRRRPSGAAPRAAAAVSPRPVVTRTRTARCRARSMRIPSTISQRSWVMWPKTPMTTPATRTAKLRCSSVCWEAASRIMG